MDTASSPTSTRHTPPGVTKKLTFSRKAHLFDHLPGFERDGQCRLLDPRWDGRITAGER